jgi:hypothetical protein
MLDRDSVSNLVRLIIKGGGEALAGKSRKNVAAPLAIVAEAEAKHAPVSGAVVGVVHKIRRPGETKEPVLGIAEEIEVRFVGGLPREVALQPADDRGGNTAVVALVDATLVEAGGRRNVELAGASGEEGVHKDRSEEGAGK